MNKKKKNDSKPISYKAIRMNTTLEGYITNDNTDSKELEDAKEE